MKQKIGILGTGMVGQVLASGFGAFVEDVVEDRHRQVARLLHVDAIGDREPGQAGLDAHDPEIGPKIAECPQ